LSDNLITRAHAIDVAAGRTRRSSGVRSADDIDPELRGWIAAAYAGAG
jgi:hypothetical protein